MAQLNPEDFGKLQNQLLELREKNYSLEDALRKTQRALAESEKKFRTLEGEHDRSTKIIQTSKKHSEVELLIRDNNYVRNKLRDQEEDFRLQNNTLLQELSRLVAENERYERRIQILCGDADKSDNDAASTDDSKEVLRLRVELTEMEKQLHEKEKSLQGEISSLKAKLTSANLQVTQLSNILKTHSIPIDEGEINIGSGDGVSFKKLSLQDDDGLESDNIDSQNEMCQQYQEKNKNLQCEIDRLNIELKEEKEKTSNLTREKLKLEEVLRESNDRTEIDGIQKQLQESNDNLTRSNALLAEKTAECNNLTQEVAELRTKLENLQVKMNESSTLLTEKEDKIKDIEEKMNCLIGEKTEVLKQKEELEKDKEQLQNDNKALKDDFESQQLSLTEQTKLADSRKLLMDEMKTHMEEEIEKHKTETESLSQQHQEMVAQITNESQQIKDQLEEANKTIEALREEATSFDSERSQLKENLDKLTSELEAAHKSTQEETDRIAAENMATIEDIQLKFEEEKRDLQTQLEISNIQKQEVEETVEELKKKVTDGEEEQRIHERKGLTLMKDLKKQLATEKKRADRLQEKLSQLLTDPAQLSAITTMSDAGDDVSSVSSWSMVSGEPRDSSTRENSIIVSPHGSPPPVGMVNEETASLVNRVTELQQQKWQLEERITHLESSSSAMADDVLKKSAIIQHYCMDKTSESSSSTPTSPVHPALGEKLNVRRMLEIIRGGGEESLKEINRRLQNLLEETLSKNIQLHKDVENLSQQVHQLSVLAAQKTEEGT